MGGRNVSPRSWLARVRPDAEAPLNLSLPLARKGKRFFWDLFCGEPHYGANVSDQPRHAADVPGGGGGDLLEWEEGGQITASCEKCRLDERTKGKRRPAVSKIQNSRSKEKGFRTHLKLNLKKMSTYLKKLSF